MDVRVEGSPQDAVIPGSSPGQALSSAWMCVPKDLQPWRNSRFLTAFGMRDAMATDKVAIVVLGSPQKATRGGWGHVPKSAMR